MKIRKIFDDTGRADISSLFRDLVIILMQVLKSLYLFYMGNVPPPLFATNPVQTAVLKSIEKLNLTNICLI